MEIPECLRVVFGPVVYASVEHAGVDEVEVVRWKGPVFRGIVELEFAVRGPGAPGSARFITLR